MIFMKEYEAQLADFKLQLAKLEVDKERFFKEEKRKGTTLYPHEA